MSDIITPNLGLTLPAVLVSPGPDYADEINADLALIDTLVFSPNNKVPTSGLNINADLPINQNNVNNSRSYRFHNNGFTLSGPSDINSIYVFAGDLWYNDAAGNAVQLTNGATIGSQATNLNPYLSVVIANYSIPTGDQFNFYRVATNSNAVTISLPAASSQPNGRFYYFKDVGNNAAVNTIVLAANGLDTFDSVASNRVLDTNLGEWRIVSDGVSNWNMEYTTTKIMMDGRFGTDQQNVLIQGQSVNIKATGSNQVGIGDSGNPVTINGTVFTVGSTTETDINSPVINLSVAADGAVEIGKTVASTLTVNATTAFNSDVTILDTLTVDALATLNASLIVKHNSTIGLSGSDIATFNSNCTFNSQCVFEANTNFNGNLISGDPTFTSIFTPTGTGRIRKRVVTVSPAATISGHGPNDCDILRVVGSFGSPLAVSTITISLSGVSTGDCFTIILINTAGTGTNNTVSVANVSGAGFSLPSGSLVFPSPVGYGIGTSCAFQALDFIYNGSTWDLA